MGDRSEIQWTDATWNPLTGCSKVSPGCAHCYAETLTMRYAKGWKVPGLPWTPKNAPANVILKPKKLDEPLKWKEPRMIFVNSMSDLFHERVTGLPREFGADRARPPDDPIAFGQQEGEPDRPDYIAEVFAVMSIAERHVFQVLTKRPVAAAYLLGRADFWLRVNAARMKRGFPVLPGGMSEYASGKRTLPNVWMGTSIENRHFAWRADALRNTPAAIRFISAEPLLGPLVFDDVERVGFAGGPGAAGPKWADDSDADPLELDGIDWLIVGGESGPKHRPMREKWVLALREACLAENLSRDPNGYAKAGPHFFFKQWGGRTPKAGGRLLEGREWNEMPATLAEEVSPVCEPV